MTVRSLSEVEQLAKEYGEAMAARAKSNGAITAGLAGALGFQQGYSQAVTDLTAAFRNTVRENVEEYAEPMGIGV